MIQSILKVTEVPVKVLICADFVLGTEINLNIEWFYFSIFKPVEWQFAE